MQNVSKQRKNAAQLKLQASKKEAPKKAPRKINAGKQAPTKLNASLDSFKKYASSTQEKKFDNGTGDVFTGTILKFPKKYLYLLWATVWFRLLCPVSIESKLSIFNLTHKAGEAVQGR